VCESERTNLVDDEALIAAKIDVALDEAGGRNDTSADHDHIGLQHGVVIQHNSVHLRCT
jgi:hypothetical protein